MTFCMPMPGRLRPRGNHRNFLFLCVVTEDARLDAAAVALAEPASSVITSCVPGRIQPFSESFGFTHAIVDERAASTRVVRACLRRSIDVRGAATPDAVLDLVRALIEDVKRRASADGAHDGGALGLVGDAAAQGGQVVLEVRDLGGGGDGGSDRGVAEDPEQE